MGGTIHDVAQVVGAGYNISNDAGDVATIVKLLRVATLVPVVLIFSLIFVRKNNANGRASRAGLIPPWFLVVFVIFVVLNSMSTMPAEMTDQLKTFSSACLVTAIAGLGMKTSLKEIAKVGWPIVILVVGETVFIAFFIFGLVHFF